MLSGLSDLCINLEAWAAHAQRVEERKRATSELKILIVWGRNDKKNWKFQIFQRFRRNDDKVIENFFLKKK